MLKKSQPHSANRFQRVFSPGFSCWLRRLSGPLPSGRDPRGCRPEDRHHPCDSRRQRRADLLRWRGRPLAVSQDPRYSLDPHPRCQLALPATWSIFTRYSPTSTPTPDLPGSYHFAPTDDYLKSILAVGSGVMYRLGESIEHTPRKYYVHKPADFDQWAKICLGIIRHYNEGWADGFHFNLRYFEIWNEAEIGAAQWDGNSEDYYRLYATAAKAIKTRYPKLLVGGPAAAGLGQLDGDRLTPTPHLRGFLEYCRKQSLPLDFLSWHMYAADPSAPVRGAVGLRRVLDEYGFQKTEIHLNEWNYLPNNDWGAVFGHDGARMQKSFEDAGGPKGAAFVACVLLGLQDAPLDMANFYTGDNGCWGLFNVFGVPKKTYHAFRAFKALVDHPNRRGGRGWQTGRVERRCRPVRGWPRVGDRRQQFQVGRPADRTRAAKPALDRPEHK